MVFSDVIAHFIGQNPRDPGTEMPILSWELSVFISCWHFLLFLVSHMSVARIGYVNWCSSLLEKAAKCQLWFWGSDYAGDHWGNLWTVNNSLYFSHWVTIQWLLIQFIAHGDWIQTHHVSRVCSWNQSLVNAFIREFSLNPLPTFLFPCWY